MSLIELLIAATLSLGLLAILTTILSVGFKTDSLAREDSRTSDSIRVAVERLGKELRQSKHIYSDSTSTKVHFWVDADNDGQAGPDPAERVTWEIRTAGAMTELVRYADDGTSSNAFRSRDFVAGNLFAYLPAASRPELSGRVRITITARAAPAHRLPRTVTTEVRLRNVA